MDSKVAQEVILRIREIAAFLLWDIGAIRVNLDEPFKLVSGNYSPIYINCRQAISFPTFMGLFTAFARAICEHRAVDADVIAGGETAGIPFAAYVAQTLSRPMIYVRKSTKGHGLASLIEGQVKEGNRVLLVEDLITDAGSKLHFIDAILAVGGIVNDVLVLFDRGQGGGEALEKRGIRLHKVTDMDTAIAVAQKAGLVSDKDVRSIQDYLSSPRAWHTKHNFPFNEVD
ncbi:MAG: orotate phosphoribosyltransferase [Sedimentisphaerales bacterium]|nr:orotate phosphoribosyltransferase [Sedimentisphaerales bacterium]